MALATAASAFLNAGLLFNGLRKQGVYQVQAGFYGVVFRYLLGILVLAAVLFYLQLPLQQWIEWGWQQRVWHISERVLAGVASYLGVLLILGLRPRHFRIEA